MQPALPSSGVKGQYRSLYLTVINLTGTDSDGHKRRWDRRASTTEIPEIQEAPSGMSMQEEHMGTPDTSEDVPGKGDPSNEVVTMLKMAAATLETAKEALNLATEKLSEML